VARLVLERGWKCLLLDGDHANPDINLYQHFLTPENIVSIFKQYDVPASPEYISIDIDLLDLWICRALMATYRPMVYSVEYNAHFPHWAAITVTNDASFRWQKDRLYGASLKALTMLANDIGYTLISVVPNFDAFFIRNDLIDDSSGYFAPKLPLRNATNRVLHLPVSEEERLRVLIDYEELCKPDANIKIAHAKAFRVAKRYLAGHGDIETWFNRALRLGRRFFLD
jgi:hypothetical protein